MRIHQVVLTLLTLASSVLFAGCMLVAVGAGAAGTVAYVKGDLEAVEAKKLDAVYEATKKALEQLQLVVSSDQKDQLSAEVIARDSDDRRIKVKLTAAAQDSTKISIRFGAFGNQTKSRMIYDKIKENLK